MEREPSPPEFVGRVARECIAVRVRLINRVITTLYDEALRPHGLRVSQANILVAVAHLGEARPAEVCRMLRIEKSTLCRDVELMKGRGWLATEPASGGRNQAIRVTREGLGLLERVQPTWERTQVEARSMIGEEGVDALDRISSRLGLGGRTA